MHKKNHLDVRKSSLHFAIEVKWFGYTIPGMSPVPGTHLAVKFNKSTTNFYVRFSPGTQFFLHNLSVPDIIFLLHLV